MTGATSESEQATPAPAATAGSPRGARVAAAVATLAAALWLGGLVVLGAIVAPTVFHEVPAPSSADAMTLVFLRFDKLAMSAAAVVALAEVARRWLEHRQGVAASRAGTARLLVGSAAALLAVVQGAWLSPHIAALHLAGAIRGLGPLGEALNRYHGWSETCGKTESLLLVGYLVIAAALGFPRGEATAAAPPDP